MQEIGWIKLHRKLLKNPVVMKDADHLALWTYLLLNAKREKCKAFFSGQQITLKPGQLIVGRRSIANELNISDSKVQRVLKTFASEQLFEQQTTSVNRLISINKWHEYQSSEPQTEPRVNHKVNHKKNESEPQSEQPFVDVRHSGTDFNIGEGGDSEPQSDEELNHKVNHKVNTVLKKYREDKKKEGKNRRTIFFEKGAILVESIFSRWGITLAQLNEMLDDFDLHILAEGKHGITDAEYRSYFHNWGVKKYMSYREKSTQNGMVF